ncbi:hypothetical protein KUCAC02_010406 [Chaenocephalus aceratus]|uniref:Uncharacterized protein n=1 Tax=Chaenocephalus aceratus TaxID=36190 RepID=A0ACB9VZ49_CHAAC|nr:hypothetical protein KUCAC02_010406 [Chaenocephalus aceratus]
MVQVKYKSRLYYKQDLVKELQRNGVSFDVRKLNVGDFLWVDREKVAPIPGQLQSPVGRELVLDYIIERKRMDDLCGSIIDGRFREQKFRLKRCGLRKPCCLVEDSPETTLQQEIVNTQCQTVKEVFARQLMQDFLQQQQSLLTAYERCAGEAEKEKLLSIRYGKLKRFVV